MLFQLMQLSLLLVLLIQLSNVILRELNCLLDIRVLLA